MKLSACIEDKYMFGETQGIASRILAAKAAGLGMVEFHLWGELDMTAIQRTLDDSGMELGSLVINPRCGCVDPGKQAFFLDAMRSSLAMLARLKARGVVVAGGPALAGATDAAQHASMVMLLKLAAPIAEQSGVQIWLEPLNNLIDHPGMFMNTASEGLDIVEEVNSPAVRLLYDVYHSTVMGESWAEVLKRGHLIGHVQVADTNGRHEPGSGTIDWAKFMPALRATGYQGDIGMEYRPTADTVSSLAQTRRVLGVQ
jgi:hydroxypyruvate isomerase